MRCQTFVLDFITPYCNIFQFFTISEQNNGTFRKGTREMNVKQ
jgi:hypothetical protein